MRPGKESRYNLNDDEDLTHYGQSLSKSDELNQKPIIDDYDDDDLNKGRLSSEHFFGGFKSKPQTKQEWIDDMIKTTKLDKYERQRENEKVFDMTQTLDEQWKALSTLMGIKEKRPKDVKETADDYDKLVNSLRFESKTTVRY
jgi:nucleolar protein 14